MLKILLVDDDLEFAQTLFNYLQNQIDKTILVMNICKNGNEAYNYIISHTIDVILLDLQMPTLDGIEFLEKAKTIFSLQKIIIISGDSIAINKAILTGYNIRRYFVKPINLRLLSKELKVIDNNTSDPYIIDKIHKKLSIFSFNRATPGYLYIVESIRICLEAKEFISPLEKNYTHK